MCLTSRYKVLSTGRPYGVARVTRVWGLCRASVYRHRRPAVPRNSRPVSIGPMHDEDLVPAIRAMIGTGGFSGEGHRKIWARLRFAGVRTSRRRVLRLMRQHGLLAPQRLGAARATLARRHDHHRTGGHDVGTHLTTVMTGEGQAAVFIAVDHCSTECVGLHATRRTTRFAALEPIRQGVRERSGAFAAGAARRLAVRHDHGSQYISNAFQEELAFLGSESSPAFVRAPEGNGCAECFIRTLKENLLWLRRFDTVEELRQALLAFKRRYNQTWIVGRHQYRTPAQVRHDQLHPAALAA